MGCLPPLQTCQPAETYSPNVLRPSQCHFSPQHSVPGAQIRTDLLLFRNAQSYTRRVIGFSKGRSQAGGKIKKCMGQVLVMGGQMGSKVQGVNYNNNFNMSQTQQLLEIIANVLQPQDANLRKQAEEILKKLRDEKPNELMLAYLEILKSTAKLECRNFSASQLRLCLSDFSPATYTNLWDKLTPEFQEKIKLELFQAIYAEADLSMKKHIADTIGEIAGTVISREDSDWPAFKSSVWQLLQDANLNSVFGGFYILESFFSYAPDHFKDNANDLFALFKVGLCHENGKLKLSALRCFGSYLEVLEPKKQAVFQGLVLNIYEAVYLLIEKDGKEDGLQALSEMLEVEPKFFRKTFKELVELMTRIFKLPNIEGGVRRMTTEILVDFAEKSPTLFRKKKEALKSTIEMVFYHMIEISSEVTEEWMRPPEGYNDDMEDDEDFETTRFGMGAIDRLIYTIGEEEMLPILSATIELMLGNADWRYKYTAVMALSQIGEYIEDVDKISSVLQMIVGFIKHENPMMRYAACHAIGQISDDMQPKFQQKFGDAIFPELLLLLQNDPVPRVVSHSAAALTNFLEGMKWEQVASRLELLVNLLLELGVRGISLVKESALSALSSTVEIAKERYQPFLTRTLEVLFSYYGSPQYSSREYKQLKGQAIETLTIIASSVGADLFRTAAPQLIQLMINLQSSQFEQTDPQKSYILAGWQRLCLVYGKQLGAHLENILPGLFLLVERVVREEIELIGDEPKEEEEGQNINTHDTEEAEVAISMLNVFIEQLGALYNPYVEQTVNLLCKIIREHPNEDVKEEACKCLPNLIIAVKDNSTLAVHLAKVFMGTLVQTMEKEYDSQIVIVELETLKSVLEELGNPFLNEQEIKDFSEKMLKLLKSSDEKKVISKEGLNEEELDEEEKQMVDEEIKQEEQVQVAISELIGALFKTHKTMTLGLANYLIYNILPKVFIENQTENMLKFGIFLIDDIVEFLGYDLLPNEWVSFATVLLKYTCEASCVLRQAACYGLGIFAERTPASILNADTLQLWLNSLLEAVKIPKGSEKEKTYGHCRDNGIAAIGKIIKAHFALFDTRPYLAIWLNFLPLRHDKDEGMVQNELLIDIMTSSPDHIIGNNRIEGIQKVLSIYGEITGNKKLYNATVAQKLRAHILALHADPAVSGNLAIWNGITEKQRENLTTFMK